MNFNETLQQLDDILQRLENNSLSLNEALDLFEHGISLVKNGENLLNNAEQKVTLLTQETQEF